MKRDRLNPAIQVLRGLAVLLVLLYHAVFPGFAGGFLGVDIFFVISGYLVTGMLTDELTAHGRIRLFGFYARRVRRLLPVALLVSSSVVVATFLLVPSLRWSGIGIDGLASTFGLSNARFVVEQSLYATEGSTASPFLHYWSLAVEEQFYLIYPAILLVLWKAGGRRLATGGVAVLVAASFLASVFAPDRLALASFYLLPTRFWELGAGALLALIAVRNSDRRQIQSLRSVVLAALCGVGLLVLSLTLAPSATYPGYAALLPVLGSLSLLWAARHFEGVDPEGSLFAKPVISHVRRLGNASYSVYLWHWPVFVLATYVGDGKLSLAVRVLLLQLSIFIGWLSYVLVEGKVRGSRWLASSDRRTFAAAGVGLLVTTCVAGALVVAGPRVAAEGVSGLTLENVRTVAFFRQSCQASETDETSDFCFFGDIEADRSVVLFGDSLASQWVAPLDAWGTREGYRVVLLSKASCPPADLQVWRPNSEGIYAECDAWRRAAFKRINEVERPEVVLMSSMAIYDRGQLGAELSRYWQEGYTRTFRELSASGAHLVVIGETPQPDQDIPNCLADHLTDPASCAFELDYTDRHRAVLETIRTSAERSGASFIDPTPWLCSDDSCQPLVNGDIAYRDSWHLSLPMSLALERDIVGAIRAYLPK